MFNKIVQVQSEHLLLGVLYINDHKRSECTQLIWDKCVYRCVLELELCTFIHQSYFIQVFLPQMNWLLSNHAFREAKERGVSVCWVWRCTEERKNNEGNRVVVGIEHCVVKSFGSGTSICHLRSMFC